ncbi:hypothetical protein [Bradyrhizobium sp. CCBAU 11357]|uniref:hypothetical protein n=1 Tax=Bradyrhizobium sp. CCBAU 11357 TaxID=1630808 RepID=UPI002304CE60|nr:hypothetical protein [Bradyrhizobium sp. CCBAU 11357]
MKVAFVVAGLAFSSTSALAQEITAVCTYERSIDDAGKSSATVGSFSVKIAYMLPIGQPLNVQVRTTKGPCFDFLAKGDEMAIHGGCVRTLEGKMKVENLFTFDRVSGAFEQTVRFNDKGGLVHSGHCVPVKPAL